MLLLPMRLPFCLKLELQLMSFQYSLSGLLMIGGRGYGNYKGIRVRLFIGFLGVAEHVGEFTLLTYRIELTTRAETTKLS